MPADHEPQHHAWTMAGFGAAAMLTVAILVLGHQPLVNAKGTAATLSFWASGTFWAAWVARRFLPAGVRRSSADLFQRFLDGVFTTLLTTLLLGALFQVTPLGAQAERLAFEAFHAGRGEGAAGQPVVRVVDTSSLAREPVTDRKALEQFVRTVVLDAAPEVRPAAVGFDINFHKRRGGFLNPDENAETGFLETCYEASAAMPAKATTPAGSPGGSRPNSGARLFLGVSGATLDPPETWLGMGRYRHLAASIDVPHDVFARSYTGFRVHETTELPGMGMALAAAYRGGVEPHNPLPGTELFGEARLIHGVDSDLHCLDYGWLPSIAREVTPLSLVLKSPEARNRLAGRVVLLGDVENATIEDAFAIPGRVRPIPGVFIHALSAETLIQGPLYEFKPKVNVGLDVAFGIVGMAYLALATARYVRRAPTSPQLNETVYITTFLFVLAVVCLWLFALRRVIWLEAFGVALGLAVGPYLEALLEKAAGLFHGRSSPPRRAPGAAPRLEENA